MKTVSKKKQPDKGSRDHAIRLFLAIWNTNTPGQAWWNNLQFPNNSYQRYIQQLLLEVLRKQPDEKGNCSNHNKQSTRAQSYQGPLALEFFETDASNFQGNAGERIKQGSKTEIIVNSSLDTRNIGSGKSGLLKIRMNRGRKHLEQETDPDTS